MDTAAPSNVHPFTAVVLDADPALLALCTDALAGLAKVYPEGHPERPLRPDFVLVALREPMFQSVARFVTQKSQAPEVPVLLVGELSDVDEVVELLKAGATDFVRLPLVPEVLRRKLMRVKKGRYIHVLDRPALLPLRPLEDAGDQADGAPDGANRRRCFRVNIPADVSLQVSSPLLPPEARMAVEDLSISSEDQPGGMRLRGDASLVAQLLAMGADVPARFHLPGEAQPLPGRFRVLRLVPLGRHVNLGVSYRLTHVRDEDKLQRLWVQCQRPVGRTAKK